MASAPMAVELDVFVRWHLASQKSSHIIGLDREQSFSGQLFKDTLNGLGLFEEQVLRVFHLGEAPVVTIGKAGRSRTAELNQLFELLVQEASRQSIGYLLGLGAIAASPKRILLQLVTDARSLQLASQPGVTIEIDLQPQGHPALHPNVNQTQALMHPVKIIMQALSP